jgi:hypothetical protein
MPTGERNGTNNLCTQDNRVRKRENRRVVKELRPPGPAVASELLVELDEELNFGFFFSFKLNFQI